MEPLYSEPIHCNPQLGIPKWAVDTGSIQSDGVLSDGQVTEPEPMAQPTEQSELEAVVTVVPVVGLEGDSDFILDKIMDILTVNYLTYRLVKCFLMYIFVVHFCDK